MAHETVTQSKRFYCLSLSPDICKTPIGNSTPPIPYNIIGEFKEAVAVSPNVKTQSESVILHNRSYIPTVKGDAPGTANGIKSGTVGKRVETKAISSTKGSNGTQTVQESRIVWMNDRNTIGRIYERGVSAARARLQQLTDKAEEFADDTGKAIKDAAQSYKDNGSEALHEFGGKAMDAGGKVLTGSAAVGVAGAGVALTGVGAPVAAGMEVVAAAGGTVGGAVTGVGAATDSVATVLDKTADLVLTGEMPDVMGAAGDIALNVVENTLLKKIPFLKNAVNKFLPGKKQAAKPPKPKKPEKNKDDGHDGGKVKQKKDKGDKPSDCCPKNQAPGGKPVKSSRPVHFGSGEEILSQTDFVIDGPAPFAWTRTYRSGSECEDWGPLGARWATPFTASLSVCDKKGIVYHEDSGRALRLPMLATGQAHDHRGEGFILRRDSDTQFTLTWRDGSVDTFARGPDGVLPHGFDGVNAMLAPRSPLPVARYHLTRSTARDGKGFQIDRLLDARPGDALLRIRSDDGLILEALRATPLSSERLRRGTTQPASPDSEPPRIDRIEEVRPDGTRLCHVIYRYEAEPETTAEIVSSATPAQQAFARLPRRYNLVAQTNSADQSRTYAYRHHLLVEYTTYSGFAHGLDWISLGVLRERWANSPLSDAQRIERHPITLNNSYQARAIRTTTADGLDEVQIDYLDPDTTRVTEADGGILDYTFNSQWLATEVRRVPAGGGAPKSLGRREWDADGNLTADIDATGHATRFTYDAAGNLATITDAGRQTTRIAYDAHNQPLAVTDALGHTTRNRFDDAGRIIESTNALGHATAYHYDLQGRLARITDARGGNKTLAYDAAGRLASYTDCSGFTSHYAYDPAGRLTEQTDAQGLRRRYVYDTLGRLLAVTYPDQTTESYTYDAEGHLVTHTDPQGQVTRYRHNGHGLPCQRIDAKGQTLDYRYDKALRLTELINANGETYRFAYDAESRLLSETGFDGKTTTYAYDDAGQLTGSECAGQASGFVRNALGQLLAKTGPEDHVRYAYDALGRLTAVAGPRAEHRYVYDPVGQLIEERVAYTLQPGTPAQPAVSTAAFVLAHAYDPLGNRIRTTLPNGRTVETLRYGSGHWHGTLWQGNSLVDLERDPLHRETTRQFGRGRELLAATRAYDPQSRLIAFALKRGQHGLHERRYAYDSSGNLTAIEDARRGNTAYAYDPLGQLLSAVQPSLAETFAFDPAGNLLDPVSGALPAGGHGTTSANDSTSGQPRVDQPGPGPAPRLPRITQNLLRHYLGASYDYDAQGNTVVKRLVAVSGANEASTLELAYDSDNRVIQATRTWATTREVARYTYDAFGRRIAKDVREEPLENGPSGQANAAPNACSSAPAKTTVFVWDGDVLAQEIRPDQTITYLYEPNSFIPLAQIESREGLPDYAPGRVHLGHEFQWDRPTDPDDAAAHLRTKREYEEALLEAAHQADWQTRLTQANDTAIRDTIRYYHCDHLGTPLELLDESGKAVWAARYKAWGRIQRYDTQDVDQPLRFQGQYEDAETGLYYNRHRYYDPDSARFITQDPIGLLGGANAYAYAPNPVAWTDPRGLAKSKGGCDPCCGKNPAAWARQWQGHGDYKGRDTWINTVLPAGTKIYGGAPGQSGFYFDKATLGAAGGSKDKLWQSLQVLPNRKYGYRKGVQEYVVKKDTCVAVGIADSQISSPGRNFGAGGGTQYFLSDFKTKLQAVGKPFAI